MDADPEVIWTIAPTGKYTVGKFEAKFAGAIEEAKLSTPIYRQVEYWRPFRPRGLPVTVADLAALGLGLAFFVDESRHLRPGAWRTDAFKRRSLGAFHVKHFVFTENDIDEDIAGCVRQMRFIIAEEQRAARDELFLHRAATERGKDAFAQAFSSELWGPDAVLAALEQLDTALTEHNVVAQAVLRRAGIWARPEPSFLDPRVIGLLKKIAGLAHKT